MGLTFNDKFNENDIDYKANTYDYDYKKPKTKKKKSKLKKALSKITKQGYKPKLKLNI